jgi:N-acetylglucosaminyldiphosphoundecaprenol N-acetyl-beta-D-mannosaminyltransferase
MFKKSSIHLLGVRIDDISVFEILHATNLAVDSGSKVVFANVNIHAMNIAFREVWFRDFLNQSEIVFCDGFGIKLAARITGQRIQYRNTPPDFIENVCRIASDKGYRIFFLGALPGVSSKAALKLSAKFPTLCIKAHHGFFDKRSDSEENNSIIRMINEFKTNILVVGLGMPLQEKWIAENLSSLEASIILPVGALFDYISGETRRAPRWMTDHGLEWLGRLFIEPQRLWRRYIIGNPLFFLRVFWHELLNRPLSEG